MTLATVTVKIAFAGEGPLDTSPTYTDVSAYVRGVEVSRGRQRELDQPDAGTAAIRLDNTDRRFDPLNTASPYHPNIKPFAHVLIEATSGVTTYSVFTGFVESWPQSYPGMVDAVVEIRCVDVFKLLSMSKAVEGFSARLARLRPFAWWPMDDPSGSLEFRDLSSDAAAAAIAGGPGLATHNGPYDSSGNDFLSPKVARFDGVDDKASTEQVKKFRRGFHGSYTVVLWYKDDGGSIGTEYIFRCYGVSGATFNNVAFLQDSADKLSFIARNPLSLVTESSAIPDTNWHLYFLELDHINGYARIYRDNVVVAESKNAVFTGDPITEPELTMHLMGSFDSSGYRFGRIAHLALFDRLLTPEERSELDAAGYDRIRNNSGNAIDRLLSDFYGFNSFDLDSGDSDVDLSGVSDTSLLDTLRQIAETEDGLLYVGRGGSVTFVERHARYTAPGTTVQATFGDAGGSELPYMDVVIEYDDQEIWNRVTVSTVDGHQVAAEDSTSITAYGERTLDRATLEPDLNRVTDMAYGLATRFKDPFARITTLVLKPASNDNLWAHVLGSDLDLYRIKVRRRPPGGGTMIEREVFIAGVEHSIVPGDWTTTWYLTPAQDGLGQPWLLGDSTHGVLDTTTKLGY